MLLITIDSAVTLVGETQTFRGWLVQSRMPSSDQSLGNLELLLGSFLPDSSGEQTVLDCPDASGIVTSVRGGSRFLKGKGTVAWVCSSSHAKLFDILVSQFEELRTIMSQA